MDAPNVVSTERRIIGIMLIRNEEHFVVWAAKNVLAFCDRLIILDNRSTDGTGGKLRRLEDSSPKISVYQIDDPNTSHRYIEKYAGGDNWIFGVDGDEIYDPGGLLRLRHRIRAGEFQHCWRIDGYMLHPTRVDLHRHLARGFISPNTPPGNKLYNFSAIDSWEQPHRERLHGSGMIFRPGFSKKSRVELFRSDAWDACDLRCLHLCFYPRSSQDIGGAEGRRNPSELRVRGIRRLLERLRDLLANPMAKSPGYKTRRYRRGEEVTRDISDFGRPTMFAALDPEADAAEAVLAPS